MTAPFLRPQVVSPVLVGGAALVAVPALLGFFGASGGALDLLAHFRVQYALLFLVPLVAALALRRWQVAAAVALLALPNAAALAPSLVQAGDGPRAEPDLTLVALNVLTSNRSFETTRRYLATTDADVVVLQEVDAAWLEALRGLHGRYPYRAERPRADNFGIAVFSRLPWSDVRVLEAGPSRLPMIAATLHPDAGPVDLLAVHLVPPLGPAYEETQYQQLAAALAHVRTARHPLVLAGDLNATPWGRLFRRIRRESRLRRSATRGVHATWPAALGPLGIPLDHLLHTPGLVPLAYGAGPDVGSDHRPVEAAYRLAQGHRLAQN